MNHDANNLKLLLVVGIAVMLLLFISFLLIFIFTQRNKFLYKQHLQQLREGQQNQLIEAAVRSEESERHRIAEELHDEVGALLAATKLHFHGLNSDNPKVKALHAKGKELLDEAIQKVRGISHTLHSSILQEFGLNEAIRHFLIKLSHDDIIETSTSLDDSYETSDPANDTSIYRIIQELTNNLLKHAKPEQLHVKSRFKNNILQITLSHNGNGLNQAQFEELRYKRDGLGLKNIQNRIILLKGSIEFTLQQDGYYYIDIFVPQKVLNS
ncbi:sensor histidine kinase [Mucilaginibacter lacusdianchii]|uniref:sensor histidine kinase n=1 Tax=Mucilaginibacter lacusdianchii TaxID=2684211 RepID=UPI00131D9E8A|nr:histidine kinase [Mucilaginibacter sp. JXJ CY 39]